MEADHEIVKDPIHGYIKLYMHEKQIIDTPVFQRLRRIKQLTAADYAYPGAVHTRFCHCLGVMHLAGIFTERLLEKLPGIGEPERKKYYHLMRLWGLTHDIGHGPFSHLFDDVVLGSRDLSHETLGAKIVGSHPDIAGIKFPYGITTEVLSSMIGSGEDWPLTNLIANSSLTERFLRHVCTGAYSADIIDYLLRDSRFTGAVYGAVDWERLMVLSYPDEDRILLDSRAEEALDSLLLARLFMFSSVYYHRTVRAFTKIAGWFLRDLGSDYFDHFLESDFKNYSRLDESCLVPKMAESKFGLMLLNRRSPYSTVDEMPLSITDVHQAEYLDGAIMGRAVSEAMKKKGVDLSEDAFFVDTPKIEFNPMLHDQKVYLRDRNGQVEERDLKQTRWGNFSVQMGVARLHIHDEQLKHSDSLKEAFRKPTKKAKTHY